MMLANSRSTSSTTTIRTMGKMVRNRKAKRTRKTTRMFAALTTTRTLVLLLVVLIIVCLSSHRSTSSWKKGLSSTFTSEAFIISGGHCSSCKNNNPFIRTTTATTTTTNSIVPTITTTTNHRILTSNTSNHVRCYHSKGTTKKRTASTSLCMTDGSGNNTEDLATRLRAQAAKLRAEAAALESEKAEQLALAAQHAFDKFDINNDGVVTIEELKLGLEKQFETELSDKNVKELMNAFDNSGDNLLQPDEFVTIDKLRNKLNELVRQEKELARQAKLDAAAEADAAKLAEAKANLLNDTEPTSSDKRLSILPYLFPLMDGLQYGRFLLTEADETNPFVTILAVLYALYRSIPLSGFVAFFALNILSFNPRVNRLVRFNMQQSIFLDIALLVPGLFIGLSTTVLPAIGLNVGESFTEMSSDVIFYALLIILTYTTISSLLGITPDKLPFISNAVNQRMPTVDMFDNDGRFIGPPIDKEENKNDTNEKK